MKCEICKREFPVLDEHHIQSKSKGGSDKKYNKASICQNCHKLVHLGLVIIEGRFRSTKGNILVWRKLYEESKTGFSDPKVYLLPNYKNYQEMYLKKIKGEKNG